MDPYQNLANAIVSQAAKDYRKALKRLKKHLWEQEPGSFPRRCG